MENELSLKIEKLQNILNGTISQEDTAIVCEKHGKYHISFLDGRCKKCEDEQMRIEREEENRRDQIASLKAKATIPLRYQQSTFDNYVTNKASESISGKLKSFEGEQDILLLGSTGTGKTHLACAMIDELTKKFWRCKYTQFYKLTDIKIRQPDLFDSLLHVDFLVIDEYGVQDSDFKSGLLFEIINERYNNLQPTLIISNFDVKKFKESISDALYSRLKEHSLIFQCKWQDYRIEKHAS
jgi:DNA replication protein DnaC